MLSSEEEYHGKQGQNELTIKVGGKLPTSASKQCLDIKTSFTLSDGKVGKHIIYARDNMTIEALYFKTKNGFYSLDQIVDTEGNVYNATDLECINRYNRVIIPNTNMWMVKYGNRDEK